MERFGYDRLSYCFFRNGIWIQHSRYTDCDSEQRTNDICDGDLYDAVGNAVCDDDGKRRDNR